jgi:outer membrane protein OmpA-like peptidoglycan-associated protein
VALENEPELTDVRVALERNPLGEREHPIFICYRQSDGKRYARWIYSTLVKSLRAGGDDALIYFDQTAPATSDWTAVHRPALERASSLVVIVTPGLYAELGDHDWVHKELNWWLQHRNIAPILIDATGEGERWIPQKIRSRWSRTQRINLDPGLWAQSDGEDLEEIRAQVGQQILGAVSGSRFEVVAQDLAQARRANRLLVAFATALVALVVGAVYLWISASKASASALEAKRLAQTQRTEALHILEWVVAETIHFPPDRSDLTDDGKSIVRGLLSRLDTLGFRGQIIIEGHLGVFCVESYQPGVGEIKLAPDNTPISECDFYPGTSEYSLALSDRLAESLKDLIATLPSRQVIDVRTLAYGKERPFESYPTSGTAREWNRIAMHNNGIKIMLTEAPPKDEADVERRLRR